jgi:hypothetical protein
MQQLLAWHNMTALTQQILQNACKPNNLHEVDQPEAALTYVIRNRYETPRVEAAQHRRVPLLPRPSTQRYHTLFKSR